jgi:cytochrome c oxidase subunit IV
MKGLPDVMSVNAALPVVYKKGFSKPSTGLPAAIRWSLIKAIMLAKIGLAQLVPLTSQSCFRV